MGRIISYTEAETLNADDYLMIDGTTDGTRKIKARSLSESGEIEDVRNEFNVYGAKNLFPTKESRSLGGINVTYISDGYYKITSGSGRTSVVSFDIFRQSDSFPDGLSAEELCYITVENDVPDYLTLQFRPYVNGSYLSTSIYYITNGYKTVQIPSNATGILIRIAVAVGEFTDKFIRIGVSTSRTKDYFENNITANRTRIESTESLVLTGGEFDKEIVNAQTNGFIRASDGTIVADGSYRYSEMIPVKAGYNVAFCSSGSSSVFTLAMYENLSDTVADLNGSIKGISSSDAQHTVIPDGINYVRICYPRTFANAYVKVVYQSTGSIVQELDELSDRVNTVERNSVKSYNLKKRKASVSFIFDDGHSKDADIKAIFDAHNVKCGFAVIPPVASRYNQYYNEGYEILAHYGSQPSEPTEASIRNMLQTAHDAVKAAVGECVGWVTPSSELAEQYKQLVYDYFEYGYTVYKGTTVDPSSACMTKTLKSYGLWRSSLQSLSLVEQKAIIDYAVANNLMVCFYGHAADLDGTDYETTENINALLNYCESVGISVEVPSESVGSFFAYRHNEDS